VTDADRRRLILLAEARGRANVAILAISRLVDSLEKVGQDADLAAVVRTTKDAWSTLVDVHDRIHTEIGKVPS
jgi:hypothetical protein